MQCVHLTLYIPLAPGYDIIHCHGARGNLMGALLRKSTGLPVVTTVHSDHDEAQAGLFPVGGGKAPQQGAHVLHRVEPGGDARDDHAVRPLAALTPLRDKISKEGYDIIHCHGARGNLMGALLKDRRDRDAGYYPAI